MSLPIEHADYCEPRKVSPIDFSNLPKEVEAEVRRIVNGRDERRSMFRSHIKWAESQAERLAGRRCSDDR